MGGTALKNVQTRRIDAAGFKVLSEEVVAKLKQASDARVEVVKSYRNKPDFGDIDILWSDDCLGGGRIRDIFPDSKEIVPNGDTVSFEYKDVQIDAIYSAPHLFDFAAQYFAYNDLGNLMGRLAHKMGLKYGHNGLYYPLRNGTHQVSDLLVTTDPSKIFRLLDLDKGRYDKGFDTLEEIFEFVTSSFLFNPEIYLFDNVNAVSRIRDKKRKTYNLFLEWCKTLSTDRQYNDDSPRWLEKCMFERFPSLERRIEVAQEEFDWKNLVHSKFNGKIVSEVTGETDKRLGQLMQFLKARSGARFGDVATWENWVIDSHTSEINEFILNSYKDFQ